MLARAQMTIRDEADVVIRSTAPASPVTDMLWLDTSSTPHQLKRWNGSAWVACGANVDLSAYYTKTEMDTKIEQTNSAIALKADSSTPLWEIVFLRLSRRSRRKASQHPSLQQHTMPTKSTMAAITA